MLHVEDIQSRSRKDPRLVTLGRALEHTVTDLGAVDAVDANAEALAELLSREQGKPLNGPNARFEVGVCAAWLRANADFRLEPEVLFDDEGGQAELHYRRRNAQPR